LPARCRVRTRWTSEVACYGQASNGKVATMGRRKRRSATGEDKRKSAGRIPEKGDRPAAKELPADQPSSPLSHPRRPKKWLLTVAILLQAGWIAFLLVMALAG